MARVIIKVLGDDGSKSKQIVCLDDVDLQGNETRCLAKCIADNVDSIVDTWIAVHENGHVEFPEPGLN